MFGGGIAMLPMLQNEVVDKNKWTTEEELLNYYAIGQCTPGIIAVNTATFIGFKQKGIIGGIVATFGVVCPSLIIITAIAGALKSVLEVELVTHIFGGIRVAVAALIISAIYKLFKNGVKDKADLAIFAVAFILTEIAGVSTILIVVGFILFGIIFKYKEQNQKEEK